MIVELIIVFLIFVFINTTIILLIGYRKCPANKILVVVGKVGKDSNGNIVMFKCIHGGAAFVWPIVQSYKYLSIAPINIGVDFIAISKQNTRLNFKARFSVGISTEEGVMQFAVERLLGLSDAEIHNLAEGIFYSQARLVVASMDNEALTLINDKLVEEIAVNFESEIKKLGLRLINIYINDIILC